MIKSGWCAVLALFFVGCPQNLDDDDIACEINEYVKDEKCRPCSSMPDSNYDAYNKSGDYSFDGDTQCDHAIEVDVVGNYTSVNGNFRADFEGNILYSGNSYTIEDLDHDEHWIHVTNGDGDHFSFNWRKDGDILCLSTMWGPYGPNADGPLSDSINYDESVGCTTKQPEDYWTAYTLDAVFKSSVTYDESGGGKTMKYEIEGNQWKENSTVFLIRYAVNRDPGASSLSEWKTVVVQEEGEDGTFKRFDLQKLQSTGVIRICEAKDYQTFDLWGAIFWPGRPTNDAPTNCDDDWALLTEDQGA